MVNGKVYIGRTDRSVEQRWKEHMANSTYYDTILYRAIRKYGIDNFYIETLEQNLSHEEAVEKEIFYIEKVKTLK